MRLVNTRYVKEGSVLARPVINSSGRILLQVGVRVTASYIERLIAMGYDVLFIEDDRLEDVEFHMSITGQTREAAYKTIKNVSRYIESGQESTLVVADVRSSVQQMINDLLFSTDILGNLTEILGYDDYTFHHSINTTIIGLVLGIASGYSEQKLIEFGMGILMHDIGKILIPENILNKKTPLTDEEFEEIKRHTTDGFNILRKNNDFGLLSAHVAFQHQEKWDGTGYPRGLKGYEIHEYARLAAVADVYEALTSKRVYRKALEPNAAYEYIVSQSDTHFCPQTLEIFKKHIAVYPSGSGVLLSNGQRGNVVKQNHAFPNRPFVRVFYENEEELDSPIDYNLAEYPSLMITTVDNR
ncbi:HD-GYP domain-containing protein [Desulfosporosinus lacus]|uniref:HD-GYP domain, c-di-GMP phosphodiesterase class II (Or its inactivated variant) n=1 Tax=Desulfosporosinus lacus DSM 15449 TaxID=1121420 RepID=A0A1M5XBH3_9FIRM|nr:HD-GYP domain-containing protein [Desulfosporosinus lacus]SHH96854.1 HD-GYP domain, c-di-GMP phosphodiesterase class II (or its inactivated variant) [Desulfosporosinus lacus DSM 15449]